MEKVVIYLKGIRTENKDTWIVGWTDKFLEFWLNSLKSNQDLVSFLDL